MSTERCGNGKPKNVACGSPRARHRRVWDSGIESLPYFESVWEWKSLESHDQLEVLSLLFSKISKHRMSHQIFFSLAASGIQNLSDAGGPNSVLKALGPSEVMVQIGVGANQSAGKLYKVSPSGPASTTMVNKVAGPFRWSAPGSGSIYWSWTMIMYVVLCKMFECHNPTKDLAMYSWTIHH